MPAEQDKDLNDLLSKTQRAEFSLLVANVSTSMRKDLEAVFTYIPPTKDDQELQKQAAELSVGDKDTAVEDKESKRLQNIPRDSDQQRLPEPEIGGTRWKEQIQQPSLDYFDEWRSALLQRLGEVVNTRSASSAKAAVVAASSGIGNFPFTDSDKLIKFPKGVETPLSALSAEYKTLLLNALLLLLLSLEAYNSLSRTLLKKVSTSLEMPPSLFLEVEAQVAAQLQKAAALKHEQSEEDKAKAAASSRWKIGLASVAGAALVGITGGLAVPLVAAGLGSVMGGIGLCGTATAGYLGAMAGSSVLVGGLFGSYGARMAGNTMRKYAKEVEDFAFLPLHAPKESSDDQEKPKEKVESKLSVTVGISGWLVSKEDVTLPWTVLDSSSDTYALRYEIDALMALGNVLGNVMLSAAFSYAKKEIISRTVFASLMVALWPLGLLKVGKVLDNPWRIAFVRSQKAGIVLADALCERVQGNRPITLVGYSLGARTIYECCKELAKRKKFGILENVILCGSPTPADTSDWSIIRTIVTGRLVNVYSSKDYILGFLYRTASIQYGIAGLQAVECSGVENVDVSDLVEGHLRFRYLGNILRERVGLEGISAEVVRIQDVKLAQLIEKEKLADQKSGEEGKEVLYDADKADASQADKNLMD